MSSPKTKLALVALIVLTAGSAGYACSSSDDSGNPAPTVNPQKDASVGGDSAVGADSGSNDSGEQPDVDAAACDGANGCWSCQPVKLDQYLNQCTDSTCQPFDNAARIANPSWDGGALPPVP